MSKLEAASDVKPSLGAAFDVKPSSEAASDVKPSLEAAFDVKLSSEAASNVKPLQMSTSSTLEAERKRGLEANRSAAVEPFVEKQVMELEPLGEDEVAKGVKVKSSLKPEPQTLKSEP